MKVENGATVDLHFSLALADGSVVDSNFAGKPATCTIGDGNLPPAFEEVLIGLEAGDEIERNMPPEHAFGAVNPANLQRFPAENFASLLRGRTRSAGARKRRNVQGSRRFRPSRSDIRGIGEAEVEVDFNHPLAGREVVFRASIVSVLAPGTSKLELE